MAEGGRPRRQDVDSPAEDDETYVQEENIGNRTEIHDGSFDAVTVEQGTSSDLEDDGGKTRDGVNEISGGSHKLTIQGGEFGRFIQKQVFHTFRKDLASGETTRPLEPGAFRISTHMSVIEKEPISYSSRVYRAIIHSDVTGDQNATVKIIPADEKHQREAKVHFLVPHHKNIVERIATDVFNFRGQSSIYIAMERCDCNLHDHIESQLEDKVPFDAQKYLSICRQIVVGLSFLHSNHVVHMDLKPGNVLLVLDKKIAKLCDFGLSRAVSGDKTSTQVTSPQGGTTGWLAPEVLGGTTKIGFKSDIFPLGLVAFYSLSYGKHPYGNKPVSWNHYIVNGENRNLEGMLIPDADSAKLLLESMMEQNPADRPTAKDVLKHLLFADEGRSLVESMSMSTWKLFNDSSTQTDIESPAARTTTVQHVIPQNDDRDFHSGSAVSTSNQDGDMIKVGVKVFMDARRPLRRNYEVYDGEMRFEEAATTERVAVKIYHVTGSREESWFKTFQKEVKGLLKLKSHPNVALFRDCGEVQDNILEACYIAMSRCHQITLQDIEIQALKPEQQTSIFLQVCHGLRHIHENGIAHMDLKPGNVLFTLNGRNAVISDFGLSKEVDIQHSDKSTTISKKSKSGSGTHGWVATEVLHNEVSSVKDYLKSDIFSLGLVGMRVIFGYHPFTNHEYPNDSTLTRANILYKKQPSLTALEKEFDGFLAIDLFQAMLSHKADERPSICEVMQHFYFWRAEKKIYNIKLLYEHIKEDQFQAAPQPSSISHLPIPDRKRAKKSDSPKGLDIAEVCDNSVHWMCKLKETSIYKNRKNFENTVVDLTRHIRNCFVHRISPTSNEYQEMWRIVAQNFPKFLPYLINSLQKKDRKVFLKDVAHPDQICVLSFLDAMKESN